MSIELNKPSSIMYNMKSYIFFWFGQLISLLGSNIVQFTIVWWITIETGSEFMLGLSTFLGFGSQLLMMPLAGVFIDRWSRKKVIATVDFLQALLTFGLIYCFIIEIANIWYVLGVITLRGVFQAFHRPAIKAIIPLLVPQNKLSRINGLNYLFNGCILVSGPVIAALLLEIYTLNEILWIDVFTFIIAVIPTIIIAIPEVFRGKKTNQRSFRKDLSEGFIFIQNTKGLLALLAIFTAANFFLRPLYVLLPLFVSNVHQGGAGELALLFSLGQLGLVVSSLIMSIWKGFKRNTSGVVLGIFIMYLGFAICVFAPIGEFLYLIIGMFVVGFGLPVANVASQTIWQKIVPPEKLGRVYSVRLAIAQGSGPIAILLSGIFGEIFSIHFVLIVSLQLGLLFLAYSWIFTAYRDLELDRTTSIQPFPSITSSSKIN